MKQFEIRYLKLKVVLGVFKKLIFDSKQKLF